MIPCDICGKTGHSWFQCPDKSKKPDGWKPDRLRKKTDAENLVDDFVVFGTAVSVDGKHVPLKDAFPAPAPVYVAERPVRRSKKKQVITMQNGSQIKFMPPSDGLVEMIKSVDDSRQAVQELTQLPADVVRGRGRPKSIDEDMKEYMARKQRESRQRRAKLKEAKP